MTEQNMSLTTNSILSGRRLTLNLVLSEGGVVDVSSCDIVSKTFRNRTSFPDHRRLEKVLVSTLAAALMEAISRVPEDAQVLSLPDFLVELPGLVLSGVHLLMTKTRNGVRNAIIRFKEFLGTVDVIFVQDIGFNGSVADHNERLATNVIADICMPLLNLCHQIEFLLHEQNQPVPMDIHDKANELQFQTELLKRFVYNSSKAQAPVLQTYLHGQPDRRRLLPR